MYNVTFIGKGTYSQNGTPVEVDVQGVQQNVAVSGGSYKLELKVHVLNTGEDVYKRQPVHSFLYKRR